MTIDNFLTSVISGALAGGGAGAVAARLFRRSQIDPPEIGNVILEPDMERDITRAAMGYAIKIGQPDAADLVAGKLRLGARIQQGRLNRRRT